MAETNIVPKLKVGIAYPAFFSSFKRFFPNLVVANTSGKSNSGTEDVRNLDLVIFSGGEDINPKLYGQSPTYAQGWDDERDSIESDIYAYAKTYNKKILGVCRGLQLITALNGGRLYQDIYIDASASHRGEHSINFIITNAMISSIGARVNSMHHQGVSRVPAGYINAGEHMGIPEVILSQNNREVLVQFHPEFMDHFSFFSELKNWVEDKSVKLSFKLNPKVLPNEPTKNPPAVGIRRIERSNTVNMWTSSNEDSEPDHDDEEEHEEEYVEDEE